MRTSQLCLLGLIVVTGCSSPSSTPSTSNVVIIDTSGQTPVVQKLTFSHAKVELDSVAMFRYYGYSGRQYDYSTGRLVNVGRSDSSVSHVIDSVESVTYQMDTTVTFGNSLVTFTSAAGWRTSDNRYATKHDTIVIDPAAKRIRQLSSATFIANNDPTNYKENQSWVRMTDVPYTLDAHGQLIASLLAVPANSSQFSYGNSGWTHESAAVQSRSYDNFVRFTDPASVQYVRIVLE